MEYHLTPWGYEVYGDLPPLITDVDFNFATGDRWASDPRVMPAIMAASAAVRDACGWHVSPNLRCRAVVDGDGSRSLWLPTTCMTSLDSLDVSGTEDEGAQWSRLGRVIPSVPVPHRLRAATVEYHAGICVPSNVIALVAGIVVRSIALSYGIASESAGGVSVSYATTSHGGSPTVTLTGIELAQLAALKAVRSHAT